MDYKITGEFQDACIETIKEWVSVPSVLDEDAKDTPFGSEIQRALETALKTCESLGFTTYIDPDGYYGYAETGQGEELMAILCHLDVVPAGDLTKWNTDPFKAEVIDGKLYGRGTQDDKGPSVAALYAVYSLMKAGYEFDKRIRFVFGTDEETLWREMNIYNEKEEKATFGFVPDADFPLTYAEKGLLQCYLVGPGSDELAMNEKGAFNVVPEAASYQGQNLDKISQKLDAQGYKYSVDGDTITVEGKSVHSKNADQGINALTQLVEGLATEFNHPTFEFINKFVGQDAHAMKLFGDIGDEMSGKLTMNIARLIITPEESRIGIDFRIPVTADKDALVETLSKAAEEFGMKYEDYDYLRSLYVPLDSELVTTLLGTYRDMTGDMSEPISSGGATFARTMDNCVAFGARTADVPVTFHEPNENMPLKNIFECMEIYAEAVRRLATK